MTSMREGHMSMDVNGRPRMGKVAIEDFRDGRLDEESEGLENQHRRAPGFSCSSSR